MNLDYEYDQETDHLSPGMKELYTDVENLKAAQLQAAQLQEAINDTNKRIKELEEQIIPEHMEKLGLSTAEMQDGTKLTVKQSIYCNTGSSKDPVRHARCMRWLEDNEAGDIIKRKLVVEFNKEEEDRANQLFKNLTEYENKCLDKTVHPSTLKRHISDLLGQGKDVPEDLFGIYVKKTVTVKNKK